MNIYKNKLFDKWAAKEGIDDSDLTIAVREIEQGLVDANLGGNILKKRIAIGHKGKSGGARTILAYQIEDKAFFIYGFAKNSQANIKKEELQALKLYAKTLLNYSNDEIALAILHKALIEVQNNG